ncbi:hypothetical protein V8C42DRAFT_247295 [Trichoderma barbatum]
MLCIKMKSSFNFKEEDVANVVKEGAVKGGERRGSSWEEGKLLTSDTIVRMGGGHLLCLIMKLHFFFSAACLVIKKKCVSSYIPASSFLYSHIHFSASCFLNVSSPSQHFFFLFIVSSFSVLVLFLLFLNLNSCVKEYLFSYLRVFSLLSFHLLCSLLFYFLFFFGEASRGGKRIWAW